MERKVELLETTNSLFFIHGYGGSSQVIFHVTSKVHPMTISTLMSIEELRQLRDVIERCLGNGN